MEEHEKEGAAGVAAVHAPNPCKLTECRGKPRCKKCLVMDGARGVDACGAPSLTEEEREHIHSAIEMLGDYEATARENGNCSIAAGANATRYVLGKLFRFLPGRTAGAKASDQRQRFEAWADDQGFPLKRLETSDGYLDLRTHGAWEAYQRGAADGVNLPDGSKR
jgi:hypothetical protein